MDQTCCDADMSRHVGFALSLIAAASACEPAQETPRHAAHTVVVAERPPLAPTKAPPRPPAGLPRDRSAGARAVDEATWAVLEQGLAASDYATRLFAAEALGCVHTERAVKRLGYLLGDPEEDVRMAAVGALHRQPGDASRRYLESVRDDEQERLDVRVLAAAALVSPRPSCRERTAP